MDEYRLYNLLEDKELYQKYIDDFIQRQTREENVMDNSKEAFYYLMREDTVMQELSEKILIQTADIVNQLNPFVLKGLRKGRKTVYNRGEKIPPAEELPQIIDKLIVNYNMNIFANPFLNEAMLHIGIIKSQLFEDGNCRTANLITNYNLLKQNIAPIIIEEGYKELYDQFINSNHGDALATLFRELSIKEKEYIHNHFLLNLNTNHKHY